MMRNQIAISLFLLLTLAACATPAVDQTAATFNESEFTSDLNICRGGAFITASAKSIGVAILGSAYGALEGASWGAESGDTAEGAVIGAAIGGTIGLTAGALEALEKHEADITGCLVQKGYRVAG
jgi:hypothetical protein